MNPIESFNDVFPEDVRPRYFLREIRNTTTILRATNPELFDELTIVLNKFEIISDDFLRAGGQESDLVRRFNKKLRSREWREARVDTEIKLELCITPYKSAGETRKIVTSTPVNNKGYKADDFKGRAALSLERNAKDGNLDRDISAYRALYDADFIDMSVIVTRTQEDLYNSTTRLRLRHGTSEDEAKKMLATTTTTNLEKPVPCTICGDGGGCSLLAIVVSNNTFRNPPTR